MIAAVPMTVIEAERAFAADAKTIGQWAAFRKWAAADATMFVPQPVRAQDWLKDRADPAKAIDWWPTAAWVSCDGSLAVDTGGWRRPGGSVGLFTTVWKRQADGAWRWILDAGDRLKRSRPRRSDPTLTRASCIPAPASRPTPDRPGRGNDAGLAPDGTLLWEWALNATGHTLVVGVTLWDGKRYADVLEDLIDVR